MRIGFAVLAALASFAVFAVFISPLPLRRRISRLTSNASRSIVGLAKPDQAATSTAWGLALVGVGIVLAGSFEFALRPQHSFFASSGTDFRAFYCSGVAANARKSPFLVEPLRSCEHRVQPTRGWSDELVTPAPLPGYDIAIFSMLSRLPYPSAKAVWFVLSLASILASVFFLTRLTRFPALLLLLGFSMADGYQSIVYGQLPAVVIGALCAAAYFLQRGRYLVAAVSAAVAMIEPHLGLPAFVALFVCCKPTRIPLGAVVAVLAVIALVAMGASENAKYFFHVLPQHAAAELVATDQYALSHELHVAGVSDRAALALGSVSYAFMIILGVILGHRLATRLEQEAFIVVMPPAVALLGGAFIHGTQFAAALPAAFLLLSSARDTTSFRTGALTLALLVVPWDFVVQTGSRVGPIIGVCMVTLAWLSSVAWRNLPVRLRAISAAVVVVAFSILLVLIHRLPGPTAPYLDNPVLPSSVVAANATASENWGAYLRAEMRLSVSSIRNESAKVPNWLAILLLAVTAARVGTINSNKALLPLVR